jgi:hypothetical protein
MSNFNTLLKEQITRISVRQARAAVRRLRKPTSANRKGVAELRRRVVALEKALSVLSAKFAKCCENGSPAAVAADGKARITGKGMRGLRRKLGLSRAKFAKLVGVSAGNVYQWERKSGPLRVRGTTRAAILGVRTLGVREAKQRLAALSPAKKAGKRR